MEQKTILIIDDAPTLRAVMSAELKQKGYKTIIVSNGEQGIDMAKECKPDLILLDIMMPGIDGFETCRRLKRDDMTRNIPVIMVSVRSQPRDLQRAVDAGAGDYVVKTQALEGLCLKVTKILED